MKNINNKIANSLKKALGFLTLLTIGVTLYGTTYRTSTGNGNWTTGATWSSSGSGTPTVYVVQSGHTVTVNGNVSGVDSLNVNGTLSFGNNFVITMNSGGVIRLGITASGTITGGNANSGFAWASSTATIKGFNSGGGVTGPSRFATESTAIAGSGIPSASFISITLAVELVSFNVNTTANAHDVTWSAAGTPTGDVFVISISADGNIFTQFAQYNAIGEGGLENYTCRIPNTGKSIYVRISIRENGQTKDIKTLFADSRSAATATIKLYPNVINATNQNVNIVLPSVGTYNITIVDGAMRTVANLNETANYAGQVANLDATTLGLLNSGIYYAVITSADGSTLKTPVVVQ